MSDNVTITPGTGATIAADDIGGVKVQRVKVQHGADGSATDASTAAPLPVVQPSAATLTALGNVSFVLAGTAIALGTAVAIPAGATRFDFVPGVNVRYTDDGTSTPSGTVGIPVTAARPWSINTPLASVKFYGGAGTVDGGFYS